MAKTPTTEQENAYASEEATKILDNKAVVLKVKDINNRLISKRKSDEKKRIEME